MRALPLHALYFAAFAATSVGAQLPMQESSTNGASSAATTATRSSAARATSAPVIDGRAGDAAWNTAPVIDQFLEYEPTTGAEPRFRTEVRILYDDRYFYLQARMYDPAPDSIISLLSRRDVRVESEQFKIVIDSYFDRRTAYQFILNPAGVKRDFYVYNDNTEDVTWDAVWDGAASVDSVGWVAEFRIPFSQMRFADKEAHTFGLLMVRDIGRTRQRISWPLFHRDRQGYVSQSGEIEGIERIPQPGRLEILPYAVTKNVTIQESASDWSHPQQQTLGADVKWGITSNLTVDATINPDFGQVEADPAVLNLGAFEQFFEERRPFFLEGAGIFNFRNSCGDIDTGCRGLFYSRRIGRSPQLSNNYFAPDNPNSSRVLGAAKLSGRLAGGLNIGVLNAVTGQELGAGDQTIEPQTSYSVVRVLQDLNNGRSGVGAMFTATNRSLDADTRDFLRGEAFTGGIDVRHRFWDNNYELTANVSGSVVRGTALAIAATQRDGIHRFQRRDDNLAYDPSLTSLSGDAQRLTVSKFGGGFIRFQSVLQRFSPGFEINDLGFQQRADEQMFRNWVAFQFNNPTKYYRRFFMNYNTFNTWTDDGMPTNFELNTNWHMELPNTHWLHFGVDGTPAAVTFDDRSARGGVAFRRAANFSVWGGWEGNRRTWYTPTFFAGTYRGDEWRTRGYWFEPGFQFRAGSAFNASIGVSASHDINDSQWFQNYGDIVNTDTAHVTFAQLDQWTMSVTTRINYTMSPTLSLQIYAQPFTSIGDYTEWKELSSTPRARDYDDRFQAYSAADPGGVNYKQINTNTVLRWEYRPGSILFLVWQQGREDFQQSPTGFQFRRDFGELLSLHPNNTFLIKMSYWFNP